MSQSLKCLDLILGSLKLSYPPLYCNVLLLSAQWHHTYITEHTTEENKNEQRRKIERIKDRREGGRGRQKGCPEGCGHRHSGLPTNAKYPFHLLNLPHTVSLASPK